MTRAKLNKVLVISPEKCIGCRSCELVCSFNRDKEFNPKNSAVSVLFYESAAIQVPVMCMQCDDPSCMEVCPVSAISKTEEGSVTIDSDKCIGCKMCISACPLGNISYNSKTKKIVKCDLCGGDPMCVKVCPFGAIEYRELDDSLDKKKKIAEKFKELLGEEV